MWRDWKAYIHLNGGNVYVAIQDSAGELEKGVEHRGNGRVAWGGGGRATVSGWRRDRWKLEQRQLKRAASRCKIVTCEGASSKRRTGWWVEWSAKEAVRALSPLHTCAHLAQVRTIIERDDKALSSPSKPFWPQLVQARSQVMTQLPFLPFLQGSSLSPLLFILHFTLPSVSLSQLSLVKSHCQKP